MNDNELEEMKLLINGSNDRVISFLFIGPPATGKTTLAVLCSKFFNCSPFKLDGSPNLSREDVEGFFTTNAAKELVFEYGIIPRAIQEANTNGIAFIIINEFNNCTESVQMTFNSLLDFQGEFNISMKGGEHLEVEEGKKIIFIGTMNEGLGGLNQVQESVMDRYKYCYVFHYPSVEEEMKLYRGFFANEDGCKKFTEFVHEVRDMNVKDGKLCKPISIRECLAYLSSTPIVGSDAAFRNSILNKLTRDPSEALAVLSLARGKLVFEIPVTEEKLVKEFPIAKDLFDLISNDDFSTIYLLKSTISVEVVGTHVTINTIDVKLEFELDNDYDGWKLQIQRNWIIFLNTGKAKVEKIKLTEVK